MSDMSNEPCIIGQDELILVTGATGFIGSKLVENLLDRGFRALRCFARPSSDTTQIELIAKRYRGAQVELVKGNLLSQDDCWAATKDAAVVFHLAAGTGEKSFPDAFMNSVVTTRNLLEAIVEHKCLRRIVSVSSFTVYSNPRKHGRRLVDESSAIEDHPERRGEAYCFAKVKQDEIVTEYAKRFGLPSVIVRPGYVYGSGKQLIASRVGIGTFGVFLHLGGSNIMPFTYVDNCAEAIALAGLRSGIDGDVFNVVDDDLPSSREFLRMYKQNVRQFRSLYVPHVVSYILCYLWERYSIWSEGQLPPVFNRRRWQAYWRPAEYSNERLKRRVGWTPKVPTAEALKRHFQACKNEGRDA